MVQEKNLLFFLSLRLSHRLRVRSLKEKRFQDFFALFQITYNQVKLQILLLDFLVCEDSSISVYEEISITFMTVQKLFTNTASEARALLSPADLFIHSQ